jgi:hypothetical protein
MHHQQHLQHWRYKMEQFLKDWFELIILGPTIGIWGFMLKKLMNSYTKDEIKEQITLRTDPLKETLDANTKAMHKLAENTATAHAEMGKTLTDISICLARLQGAQKTNETTNI